MKNEIKILEIKSAKIIKEDGKAVAQFELVIEDQTTQTNDKS